MAIEYTYYSAVEQDSASLRARVGSTLDARLSPDDGSVVREGLWAVAYRVEPGDEATAPGRFGFPHRATVSFRLSSTHRELEEHNTALMVGTVLSLAAGDGVLLFNGEEAVIRISGGEVTFAAGWEDWDDMPEVVALRREHPVAPLAQPLL
jgi:hypothetical protein